MRSPDGADFAGGGELGFRLLHRCARCDQRGPEFLAFEVGCQRGDFGHPLALQRRSLGARRIEYCLIVTGFRARLSRLFHDGSLLIWAGCPSSVRSQCGQKLSRKIGRHRDRRDLERLPIGSLEDRRLLAARMRRHRAVAVGVLDRLLAVDPRSETEISDTPGGDAGPELVCVLVLAFDSELQCCFPRRSIGPGFDHGAALRLRAGLVRHDGFEIRTRHVAIEDRGAGVQARHAAARHIEPEHVIRVRFGIVAGHGLSAVPDHIDRAILVVRALRSKADLIVGRREKLALKDRLSAALRAGLEVRGILARVLVVRRKVRMDTCLVWGRNVEAAPVQPPHRGCAARHVRGAHLAVRRDVVMGEFVGSLCGRVL